MYCKKADIKKDVRYLRAEEKRNHIDNIINPPPIGLMPENLWKAQRLGDIHDAMNRYKDAGIKIPTEWYEEFYRLYDDIMKRTGTNEK